MKKIIGFGFIVFGLIWCFLNKVFCKEFCEACNNQILAPCYFLILFTGIIFIICGVGLILTFNTKINKNK